MNYLAHSYLTLSDGQIVGQFLEDFIPNRDRFSFPPDIVEGILLHRHIDTFTDAHPETREAKKIFNPLVRLYAGAFVDVSFDYFLANMLSEKALQNHARRVYRALGTHEDLLPEKLKMMCKRMEKDDWLYNYSSDRGIRFSFQNVLNKAKYLDGQLPVFELFQQNKTQLQAHFEIFFPDLMAYCAQINADFKSFEKGSGPDN